MSTISGNNTGAVSLTVIPNETAQTNYTIGSETNGAVYPFTRARMVTFIAQALKPNTRYYPFFNDVYVGAYCTTVSSPTIDANGKIDLAQRQIKTDNLGNVTGNFFIPGNTFASGSLVFKLVDTIKTVSSKTVAYPIYGSAEAIYESGTLLKEVATHLLPNSAVNLSTIVPPVVQQTLDVDAVDAEAQSVLEISPVQECTLWYFEYTLSSSDSSTFTIATTSPTPPEPQAQTGAVIFPEGSTNEVIYVSTSTEDGETYYHTFNYLSDNRTAKFRQETILPSEATPPDLTGFRPSGIADSVTVNGGVDPEWVNAGSSVCPINYGSQIDCRTDPLAQSFYIDSKQYPTGLFLTSIGIYFRTVDRGAPVIMEIRSMENGLPGTTILPGATAIVPGKAASASKDGSVPTIFRFTQPIYLQPNTNYCFVTKSSSLGYTAWTSIVGKLDTVTGKVIDTQPYTGTLFKSENNYTWVPSPLEDLKFDLYKATFTTGDLATLIFTPKEFTVDLTTGEYENRGDDNSVTNYYSTAQTLPLSYIYTFRGSKDVKIRIPLHGLVDGDYIYLRGVPTPSKADQYNNIRANQLVGQFSVTVNDGDHVTISTSGRGSDLAANLTGPISVSEVYGVLDNEPGTMPDFPDMVGAEEYNDPSALGLSVSSNDDETFEQPTAPLLVSQKHFVVYTNILVNEANLDYLKVDFPSAGIIEAVQLAGTGYTAPSAPDEEFDGTSKFVKFDEPKLIANAVNEYGVAGHAATLTTDGTLGYPLSCKTQLILQSTNKDLSPVVDTNGINLLTRSFKIDNQGEDFDSISTAEDMADPAKNSELSSGTGLALAKYKSPIIKLDKAYNSMKIFVTGNCASPATFDVYIRTSTDSVTHIDHPWTWVPQNDLGVPGLTPSADRSVVNEWFFEYLGETNYFDVFDIKIVMRTTNSCFVPKIYGLRTIAATALPSIEDA